MKNSHQRDSPVKATTKIRKQTERHINLNCHSILLWMSLPRTQMLHRRCWDWLKCGNNYLWVHIWWHTLTLKAKRKERKVKRRVGRGRWRRRRGKTGEGMGRPSHGMGKWKFFSNGQLRKEGTRCVPFCTSVHPLQCNRWFPVYFYPIRMFYQVLLGFSVGYSSLLHKYCWLKYVLIRWEDVYTNCLLNFAYVYY